jgi:hypothetical protein
MAARVLHDMSNSAPRRLKPQRGDYQSILKTGAIGKDGRPHGAYRDYFQVDLQEAVRKRVDSYDPSTDKYDKMMYGSLLDLEEEHKVPKSTIHDYAKKAQTMNVAFNDPSLYQKKGRVAAVPLEIEAQLVRMLKWGDTPEVKAPFTEDEAAYYLMSMLQDSGIDVPQYWPI